MQRAHPLCGRLGKLEVFYWKFYDKSTSMRPVAVNADEAVMVGHNRCDDREPKASATLFGRKIRLENARAIARLDAGAIIAYFERHHTRLRIDRGAHFDPRPCAIMIRTERRRYRVVEQVNQCAFQG